MDMALKRTVEATLISLLLALAPQAHAQSVAAAKGSPEPSSDQHPVTEVHSSTTWTATDEVQRAPEGGASIRPRLILPGDFGTWAFAPPKFSDFAVRVTGGEVALTSRLSLVLEGADDPFDHRFSGMASGFRLHLLPLGSSLQLSLAGGFSKELSGASGLWSQVAASQDLGRWHLAGALRASALSGAGEGGQTLAGSTGVAFDLLPTRIGLEYAFEQGRQSRSALLPWVEVPTKNQHIAFRAGPEIQLHGSNPFPARLSAVGSF